MISVIIPIYNVFAYLKKCIDSTLAQTFGDLQIISVDDGSPDECAMVCDEYSLLDSRIITIHKPNGGLSSARNKGLDIASGEYVNFLDSDDYILPEMLSDMLEQAKQNAADMVLCGFNRVDENGNITDTKAYKDCILTRDEALELLVQGNVNFIIACAKLYKRYLFNDLRFIEGKIHEDEFMAHYVLSRCKTVFCISTPYYQYFERTGSITNKEIVNLKSFNAVEAFVDRTEFLYRNRFDQMAVCMLARSVDLYVDVSQKIVNHNLIDNEYTETLKYRLKWCVLKANKKSSSFPRQIGFALFLFSEKLYVAWMHIYKGWFK